MPNRLLILMLEIILVGVAFLVGGVALYDLAHTHNRVTSAIPTCTLDGSHYICYDVVPADTLGNPYLASDSLGTRLKRK